MKKSIYVWQIIGFIFTGIMGVILHFLFGWTGESIIVAPFAAVNESIWEHIKLLFFPMFVFALAQRWYKDYKRDDFWCVKIICTVIPMMLIPILYYTVKGVFGASPDWMNITIFFITAAIGYFLEAMLFKRGIIKCKSPKIAFFILCTVALIFVLLTFYPIKIPLFEDPITRTHGYNKILF